MNCGGDYIIDGGVKNCYKCNLPHTEKGYEYVINSLKENGIPIIPGATIPL
jgi:Zn-finger protein